MKKYLNGHTKNSKRGCRKSQGICSLCGHRRCYDIMPYQGKKSLKKTKGIRNKKYPFKGHPLYWEL